MQYQFFKRYIFQATYQRVKNQIYELIFATDDNIQVTTPVNAGMFEYIMLTLTNTSCLKGYANLDINTLMYQYFKFPIIDIEYPDGEPSNWDYILYCEKTKYRMQHDDSTVQTVQKFENGKSA